MQILIKKCIFLVTGIFMVLCFGTTIAKAEQKGIQISPLTFKFDVEEGKSQTGKIFVKNLNDEPMNYICESEDFNNVSDEGAPSFAGQNNELGVTTLADWISFQNDQEGILKPGEEKEINFIIDVPIGAEPGGHYAAVFAKTVKKNAEGKTELGISSRVGSLILVSIPGETVKTAQITDFSSPKFVWKGPVDFSMKVKNTGTIHYDSVGTVEIKPLLGKTSIVDLGTHTVIPKNSRIYNAQWPNKYPFGYYAITALATDGDNNVITTTSVMWALPLIIVIPVLVGLVVVIFLIIYLRRHLRFK